MKHYLTIFFLKSIILVKSKYTNNITDDVEEILNVIPKSDIILIARKWIFTDKECRDDWNYVTSSKFYILRKNIENSAEFSTVRKCFLK